MASSNEQPHQQNNNNNITRFMQSASSSLFSLLTTTTLNPNNTLNIITNNKNPSSSNKINNSRPPPPVSSSSPSLSNQLSIISTSSSSICVPLLFSEAPPPINPSNFALPSTPNPSSKSSSENNSMSSTSGTKKGSGFPSTVRIASLNSNQKGGGATGGPAFVGQVFSMCDISGTGLMAVSTHIQIPFLSKRTPEWIKRMFAAITKNERDGPMFRFFMDVGDAVSYVKQLNIPTGVVGACRLDLAYEHFKEKPHMFEFVPNEKQVKAANKLLKTIPQNSGMRSIDGVPVFTAENLDIAIATNDGIKWYTPYFFDKKMLDNILEESVDQHFHTLIQNRRIQRRSDLIDDSLSAESVEDNMDSLWEPPEVQEVMDEMGQPTIPLSVISKVAEMQLHYAVDKVILGNRWLRKATGIQPKFPYMVDSFERRTAASLLKDSEATSTTANIITESENHTHETRLASTDINLESAGREQGQRVNSDSRFPFGDWFSNPWSRRQSKTDNKITSETSMDRTGREYIKEVPANPLLPKITMVGISTSETGQISRANLKKTMEDLTQKLEQTSPTSDNNNTNIELRDEIRDPLFVANVGDYYSASAKTTSSSRWVRAGNN